MSDPLRTSRRWVNNDTTFLRALALDISSQTGAELLSSDDLSVLKQYGTVQKLVEAHDTQDQESKQDTDQANAKDINTLFHGRRLLYEASLYNALFPEAVSHDELMLVSAYQVDQHLEKLEELDRTTAAVESTKIQGRREFEDDYDDEASDDDEINVERQVKELEAEDHAVNGADQDGDVVAGDSSEAPDAQDDDALLIFELNSMFHTLEYDRHAMIEQNALDASDRQVEHDIQSTENQKLSNVNFGAANLSLKHLIAKIDESREKLQMSDNELRTLLSDVRKNRSKWANEEKVGQEELYEAAERVVLELRGYTEHSTAFLNKVTKRDVPDYYNVIKNPMDLGTLMKNLKNLVYKSKAEFERDVMLIWENCLTYNAVETHPLRRHAVAMRRKSEQLLAMVPDVVVRDRAEVEAEEFGVPEQEDDDEEEDKSRVYTGKSTRGTFGSKSSKAKKANHAQSNGQSILDSTDGAQGIKKEAADADILPSPAIALEAQKSVSLSEVQENGEVVMHTNNDTEQIESEESNFALWRSRTKKIRATYASRRHRRLKQDSLNLEEDYFMPTPQSLAISRSTLEPENEDENRADENIIIQEYEPCSIPELGPQLNTELGSDKIFAVSDTLYFEPPQEGLVNKMRATTLEMKSIRQLCTKLSTLKLMQDPTMNAFPASYFRQLMDAETPLRYDMFFLERIGIDDEPCGGQLSQALLHRSAAQILYQAGFEDFATPAITAFAEISGEFLKTLGKLMVQFTESRDNLGPEDILKRTLFEVGIENYAALEDYVLDDIYGRHERITQLHGRLKKFLNDFIHGTANIDGEPNGTNLFDEGNQDAFVSGNFGDETGEDFFGFRELGLDKEFGMSSLSVPLRLLQGRLRPISAGTVTLDGDTVGPRFDRKFPHVTQQVADLQIGLFRPFLQARLDQLDEEDEGIIIEDEELPIRQRKPKPRLGPTGKITSAMKRPLRDPNSSPSKKRKRTMETATKDQEVGSPTASVNYEIQTNGTG